MASTANPKTEGAAVWIAPISLADLPAIAAAHRRAFPGSFLTALGAGAVERYYRWQMEGPHDSVGVAAFVGGRLAGFCFAGVFRGAMSGFLRKYRAYLAVQTLLRGGLLWKAEFRARLAQGVRLLIGRRTASTAPPERTAEPFGILSIGVEPACQGLGVGGRLMQACEQIARERGFLDMELTVATGNRQAVRFYENAGWERVAAGGVWTGRMRKQIS